MKQIRRLLHLGLLSDGLAVAGAVLIAVGAGLIFLPAGLITGGVLALAGARLAVPERGDGG